MKNISEMRRRHSIWRLASFATLPILGLVLYIVLPAHHKSQEELEEKIRNSEYVRYPYMHRITKVRKQIFKNSDIFTFFNE